MPRRQGNGMKKVICFGDSNTFGFNPKNGARYDANTRWAGLLSQILGEDFQVKEEGCNNRTGFFVNPDGALQSGQKYLPQCFEKHKTADIFVFALGTNDLQKIFNLDEKIAEEGLKNVIYFVRKINPESKIIIIPPVALDEKVLCGCFSFQFDEKSVESSKWIQKLYEDIAKEENCEIFDINKCASPSYIDGLHYDEESHKIIAEKLAKQILNINKKEGSKLTQFSRTELIFGNDAMQKLSKARVAIFGIGGVGSYTAEALARSGVGTLDLIDDDKVCLTNINRQLFATRKTVGKHKVDVAKERLEEINPKIVVNTYNTFYMPETSEQFDFSQYDYIVDAIDTVKGKIELVMKAQEANTPIICSMGAGNKVDATAFKVSDIYKTRVCPLARVMRTELKKRRVKKLKVVYSEEVALKPIEDMAISCKTQCICPAGTARKCTHRNQVPGSNAFVPPVVGLIIAGEVIKDITAFSR